MAWWVNKPETCFNIMRNYGESETNIWKHIVDMHLVVDDD